jgi:hypothetical protein
MLEYSYSNPSTCQNISNIHSFTPHRASLFLHNVAFYQISYHSLKESIKGLFSTNKHMFFKVNYQKKKRMWKNLMESFSESFDSSNSNKTDFG